MNNRVEHVKIIAAPHARACGACLFVDADGQEEIAGQRSSILAELAEAFPAVLGRRFWPRVRWIVGIIVLLAVLRSIAADCNDVPSGSMIPTLLVGDLVFVNKLAFALKLPFTTIELLRWADPQRGDVVVCFSPITGTRLVKRVIGLPGDSIEMENNVLHINGIAATYLPDDRDHLGLDDLGDRLNHALLMESAPGSNLPVHSIMETPSASARRSFSPTIVPRGRYFLMGDNRDESLDSRYIGFVSRRQIIGRVGRILLSFESNWLPRMARILKPIR